MEEKERFEYYPKQNQLYDKTNDELYCLGIEQDKTRLVEFLNLMNEDWLDLYERNKELREENQQLKIENGTLKEKILIQLQLNADNVNFMENQRRENQQLKQSQKQLAVEELEKIYNLFEPYENSQKDTILCANNDISFIDYLENRIKELGGEENE